MDDLVLSGIALYRATQNQIYLDQSLEIYVELDGNNDHTEPLDWDNKVGNFFWFDFQIMCELTL